METTWVFTDLLLNKSHRFMTVALVILKPDFRRPQTKG